MTRHVRLLISTGEVSGDLQGSLLIQALHRVAAQRDWSLEIQALGGDRMAQSGAAIIAHTARLGAIGLLESLPYVYGTLKLQHRVKQQLRQTPPDLVVLIDYPGANLPLARYLKRTYSCPILYYIAPQEWVWAFSPRTTQQIVETTTQILAIFPQEAAYYTAQGANVQWVGHPFLDTLPQLPDRSAAREQLGIPPDQQAIALLPASRPQELTHILPVLAKAAQQIQARCPQTHFWIPAALPQFQAPLAAAIQQFGLQATLTTQPQLTLAAADLAIGKSGTANLEAALLNVPQIVLYRIHPISGWLYRRLLRFKVPFISPVNLLAQKAIVPELLQSTATPDAITQLALDLLPPAPQRQQMLHHYQHLRTMLGSPGATERAAIAILEYLTQ